MGTIEIVYQFLIERWEWFAASVKSALLPARIYT
jgi:hypothetical protein|tara:strand:- start:1984 stop:2085 length:102 start_codon:yes stop_codon:yes gene_type:complete